MKLEFQGELNNVQGTFTLSTQSARCQCRYGFAQGTDLQKADVVERASSALLCVLPRKNTNGTQFVLLVEVTGQISGRA